MKPGKLLMSVVMNCKAPDHHYSSEPVAKLNQMGQWTCCLKKFGGLYHQKVANLQMLNGATWESTEPTSFNGAKNLEAFTIFFRNGLDTENSISNPST